MLSGRAADIKRHRWFEGLDWDALANRRMEPGRKPKEDSAKRIKELTVQSTTSPTRSSLPADRGLACAYASLSSCTTPQDAERKQKRDVRETPEELQECELVFGDF